MSVLTTISSVIPDPSGKTTIRNSSRKTIWVVWVHFTGDWGVQTFDFSRRGRSSLPLWGGGGGEIERMGIGDCCDPIFEKRDDMDPWDLKSLSDGSLFYLVSNFSHVGSEITRWC